VQVNLPLQVKLQAVYPNTLRGRIVDKSDSQARGQRMQDRRLISFESEWLLRESYRPLK